MRRAAIPEPRGRLAPPPGLVARLEGQTMGATWTVQVAGLTPRPDILKLDIETALASLVSQMSHWEKDSEISRYNRAAAGERIAISPDFATVVRCALSVASKTNGAFDPTLGEIVEAWGFGPSQTIATTTAQARGAAWRDLDLDARGLLQPGGVHLDLSGIAKGYAVDKVAGLLAARGFTAFLVEIGGEMYGEGLKPDGAPWWARIETPRPHANDDEEIFVALPGWALATSGDYRRFFERDGRRYSHTLDPTTGAPVDSRLASVSVLAHDCMQADAWATALTVMGEARGLAVADERGLAALFLSVSDEASVRIEARASAAWAELWA